jgi:Lrp/AsnC family leucine-responsive transcriptional regulator
LERSGYILGYSARLDPVKIQQGHLVYVQVKLKNTSSASLTAFNKAVRGVPEILTCHMLSGGYDYLLKIRTKDMASYRQLLGDVISDLPDVLQTSTFPVMEEVKDSSALLIAGIDERA